jgi:hypothetical protein
MNTEDIKIVVTGDICDNFLFWKTNHLQTNHLSWTSYPNMNHILKSGEALFLSELVGLATGLNIISPLAPNSSPYEAPDRLLSTVELALFPVTSQVNDSNKVYRVQRFHGFSGPSTGIPKLLAIDGDTNTADIVILDDENNGFNDNEVFWPKALKATDESPLILYKTNRPSSSTKLWQHIEKYHAQNTIVVINGDDLRAMGVNISKGLSWEKTALDFVWQIHNNPNISFLSSCSHFIVPLGLEGALYYRNDDTPESRLFFLTYAFEGGTIKEYQGKMYGITSCFVAGLTKSIVLGYKNEEPLNSVIIEGIREGIAAAQKYYHFGFGQTVDALFPNPNIFKEGQKDIIYKEYIQDVTIRNSSNPNCAACWYILKDKSSNNLSEIAYDIVKYGEKSALKYIPIARFGNLKTVDRTEIESYRSIKKLMLEYLHAKNSTRPLCLSVFGTPGSGKSFGVAEVASSIDPTTIETLNFNLSQFKSPSDLNAAFHKVRDLCLRSKMPLVFFDEFDSALEGKLGWLKYFLAPMQDGVFRDGDTLHPIGKAIFVFVGGTSSTFKGFCGEMITDEREYKDFYAAFRNAKGPDFISRLRGYVNILGPNQTDEQRDHLFIIRRAMLLRSLLERKVPHLINKDREAQIDNGVLRAMLKVPAYKHESRSMEAILEMSSLSNSKKWEQSLLPSKEQLKLHVDEEQFSRLLMYDAFFSEKTEKLARDLHDKHTFIDEKSDMDHFSYLKPWNDLNEEDKNAIRNQVRHIPNALLKINYELISVKAKPDVVEFTPKELNILAEYEHRLWCLEMKETGWIYGPVKDEYNKTHACLLSWEQLPQQTKNLKLEKIKAWPKILADSYFKIERLKFLCYCESHMLE